jgi:hypothetical protein
VKVLLATAIALCATAALGRPAPPSYVHPAVVRVIAPERNGASLGSGTLVAVSERYGLVLTNWHVVRDASTPPTVVFPDGFRSGATVARVDRDWDLAALVVWRPNVRPVPLAANVPRLGEPLSIAGYGGGNYRLATGRCTQYVSPGGSLPYEMIELSTAARQGDSGGPILNQQGELAGVLFGASWTKTVGSHCLRVRQFLAPIMADFDTTPGVEGMMIAQRPQPRPTSPEASAARAAPPTATIPSGGRRASVADAPPNDFNDGWTAASPEPWLPPEGPLAQGTSPTPTPGAAAPGLGDQTRNILAIVGLLALFFHGLRLLGAR